MPHTGGEQRAGVPGWTVVVGEGSAAEFYRKVALQVRSQYMLRSW